MAADLSVASHPRWKTIARNVLRTGWRRVARSRGAQASPAILGSVARRWAGLASEAFVHDLERVSWTGIPQIHANHNYLITGSPDLYWVDWIRDRFFPDGMAGDALSLGCGAGHLDRIFKSRGFTFRSFTGIDISDAAVARARTLADEIALAPTIRYAAEDLNHCQLPVGSYDFIYFFQSLHHIEALEHVLAQCHSALRPNGVLMVNEFVGPSRFQWTPQQIGMANALIARVPASLRRDLTTGTEKTAAARPSIAEMVAYDPSEAVRSAEIEPLLKARFTVVDEWNWGGTLNHLVFANIAANFDADNPCHRSIVDLLIHHENTLIEQGPLPSDFKVFMARRKP